MLSFISLHGNEWSFVFSKKEARFAHENNIINNTDSSYNEKKEGNFKTTRFASVPEPDYVDALVGDGTLELTIWES